ncbi:MAG: hypothetical protein AAFN77_21995 [Planctomycetota bacterium]
MISLLFAFLFRAWLRRARPKFAPTSAVLCITLISVFASTASAQSGFRGLFPKRTASPKPAPVSTTNFVVYAPDAMLAQRVAQEAERYRKELAVEWIGEELPDWNQKCPIYVQIAPDAGGETSFAFVFSNPNDESRGTPIDWQMKIFGPPDRLLDAVLPHEVTHTIFATYFGRPLPRWADEGACTTVEHQTEREKNHRMLMQFLTASPSRGIPFNRMFTMKQYPQDILPLYAQGYSLAKFLIFQKGRRHFLDFVNTGMQYESNRDALTAWDDATQEYYNFEDLSELQIAWLRWVKSGSQQADVAKYSKVEQTFAIASNQQQRQTVKPSSPLVRLQPRAEKPQPRRTEQVASAIDNESSWYVQQMRKKRSDRSANQPSDTIWR